MDALEPLGHFFGGFGVFLLACAALWFVSVHKDKEK